MQSSKEEFGKVIRSYVQLSKQRPGLSHVYAMMADHWIKKHLGNNSFLSFTDTGYYLLSNGEEHNENFELERLESENSRQRKENNCLTSNLQAMVPNRHLAINLEYANRLVHSNELWKYFLNKYLYQFAYEIALADSGARFLSIIPKEIKAIDPLDFGVSVIMCAYQAEETIFKAARSILNQTHKRLELIIVNDGSDDKTGQIAEAIRQSDDRVKVIHNHSNYGSYVSRNRALQHVTTDFFTCHDADDIAMPSRIDRQLRKLLQENATSSTCLMLRFSTGGTITRQSLPSKNSPDGYCKLCHISGLHKTEFFKSRIGYWDSVKFGADTELLFRIQRAEGAKLTSLASVEYLSLDSETCITRAEKTGLFSNQGKAIRLEYSASWSAWHKQMKEAYLPFPHVTRLFQAPREMLVDDGYSKEVNPTHIAS